MKTTTTTMMMRTMLMTMQMMTMITDDDDGDGDDNGDDGEKVTLISIAPNISDSLSSLKHDHHWLLCRRLRR